MTPDQVEAVIEHIDRLGRAGHPTGPTDHLAQNLHGGRMSRQRIGQIVREAAEAASARRVANGLPPLPRRVAHRRERPRDAPTTTPAGANARDVRLRELWLCCEVAQRSHEFSP
jgi:hypothetical protein